jgi:Domain found in Dishevelled, Egl-10, and Pleckstrin (DEP)
MAKISYVLITRDDALITAWRAAFATQGLILLTTPARRDLHSEVVAALGDATNPVLLIDLAYLAQQKITLIDWIKNFNQTYRHGVVAAISAHSAHISTGQNNWAKKSGALGLLSRAHVMEMPQTMMQFLRLSQEGNAHIKLIGQRAYLGEVGFDPDSINDELTISQDVMALLKQHSLTPAELVSDMEMAPMLAHEDRSYMLKKYRLCVVAKDIVSWLARRLDTSRPMATNVGKVLQRLGYIYHVVYEQDFNDATLYFRIARNEQNIDDMFIQVVLQKLLQNRHGLVADRSYGGKKYADCFVGSAFVDWLVDKHRFSADKAIDIGRQLFDLGAFHHVLNEHPFIDGNYYYSLAKKPEA